MEHTERRISPLRKMLDLLSKDDALSWDWVWFVEQMGKEATDKLKDDGLVYVNRNEFKGRVWDGKGMGWTPWKFTELGRCLVKVARTTVPV
jgi:hypothetical protein